MRSMDSWHCRPSITCGRLIPPPSHPTPHNACTKGRKLHMLLARSSVLGLCKKTPLNLNQPESVTVPITGWYTPSTPPLKCTLFTTWDKCSKITSQAIPQSVLRSFAACELRWQFSSNVIIRAATTVVGQLLDVIVMYPLLYLNIRSLVGFI